MLITENIKIIIIPSIDRTYCKLNYYDYEKYKNENELIIEIDIKDLNHTSKDLVKVKCDICGEEKEIQYYNYWKNIKKYNIYTCSQKCAQIKNKKTNLKKYGSEWALSSPKIREQIKKTCLEIYGVDNPMKNKEIKNRAENTLLENYGVKVPMQNEEIKEKQHKTMKELYGSEIALKVDNFLQKNINTQINKTEEEKKEIQNKRENSTFLLYGVKNIAHDINLKNNIHNKTIEKYKNKIKILKIENKNYTIECKCGHICEINYNVLKYRLDNNSTICTFCNPINSKKSGMEYSLREYIKSLYSGEILVNKRFLNKKELDIYLPDLKIAFEFNGLYWHNEKRLPKDYHLNKTEECEKLGIHLIHIYEDDWIYKNDIVKSLIKNKLNIYDEFIDINNCIINDVSIEEAKIFLNNNYINGYQDSDKHIGLLYNNELISLLSIKDDIIISFCNKNNIQLDSFDVLFNQAKNNNKILIDRSYENCIYLINKDFVIKEKIQPKKIIKQDKKIYNSGYFLLEKINFLKKI
jgi:hypothetical protein